MEGSEQGRGQPSPIYNQIVQAPSVFQAWVVRRAAAISGKTNVPRITPVSIIPATFENINKARSIMGCVMGDPLHQHYRSLEGSEIAKKPWRICPASNTETLNFTEQIV